MTFLFYFSFTLYFTGLINCIFLTNKNILNFLTVSEIMFLGVDILLMGLSIILNEKIGLIYAVFILAASLMLYEYIYLKEYIGGDLFLFLLFMFIILWLLVMVIN